MVKNQKDALEELLAIAPSKVQTDLILQQLVTDLTPNSCLFPMLFNRKLFQLLRRVLAEKIEYIGDMVLHGRKRFFFVVILYGTANLGVLSNNLIDIGRIFV